MFRNIKSEFTGSMGKYIGVSLGCFLLSLTVIGLPFAICIREKWMIENSRVVGMPLMFKERAFNCLARCWYGCFLSSLLFRFIQ